MHDYANRVRTMKQTGRGNFSNGHKQGANLKSYEIQDNVALRNSTVKPAVKNMS